MLPGHLKCLFSPQHGLYAEKQDNMKESPDAFDPALNIPVFSLSVFSIETEDRDIESRVKCIGRLLHIVLLFSIKAVLRAKKALQMAWQHGEYQVLGVS